MQPIIEIKVRGYHIDHFNHVNHTRYLEFMEEGRWSYFEEKNLFHIFHEKGIIHAVVNININYKNSAKDGDVLIIATDLLKAGKNSFTMFQKIFLKGTDMLIADAKVTNVFIDMNAGEVVPVDNEIISLWPDLGKYFNKDKSSFSKLTCFSPAGMERSEIPVRCRKLLCDFLIINVDHETVESHVIGIITPHAF